VGNIVARGQLVAGWGSTRPLLSLNKLQVVLVCTHATARSAVAAAVGCVATGAGQQGAGAGWHPTLLGLT
jgi:hypothetical protein